MNLENYANSGIADFRAFAGIVASILTAALQPHKQTYRIWQIQHREKSVTSLERKLKERGLRECATIENEIKDLAGCRIVFYVNSDVDKFLQSGIIRDNFLIDWSESKIHQPLSDDEKTEKLYRAIHYIVSLKPDRSVLAEYVRFSGLRCEIQIQTILNHAWAETAHDITYHGPELSGFGKNLYQAIDDRLRSIITKYLLPAGYEFQKVQFDFDRLIQGKELFDRNIFAELEKCKNNNERYDTLKRFRDYVLPNFDDPIGIHRDVVDAAIKTIEAARLTPAQPIETPFGKYDGQTMEEVIDIALDIIDNLRYVEIGETFRAICNLYIGAKSEKEKGRIIESAKRLAKHELQVWKQAGPYVQSTLITQVNAFSPDELSALRLMIISVCEEVLSSEILGTTSSSYNTVTFHRGAVIAQPELEKARSRAIEILKHLYLTSVTEADKRQVLGAFSSATHFPSTGGHTDELTAIILKNCRIIADFYTEVAANETYEILQHLEHNQLWIYRWYGKLGDAEGASAKVAQESRELVKSIFKFRDTINANKAFVIYKTLVGFESVFSKSWEDNKFNYQGVEAFRAEQIEKYVNSVDETNSDEWHQIIKRCANTESDDLATFPTFGRFLEALGKKKPNIVLEYLQDIDGRIAGFIPSFLAGLWKSSAKKTAVELAYGWVNQGKYLSAIARHCRFSAPDDKTLLHLVTTKAIDAGEPIPLIEAIAATFANFDPNQPEVIEDTFIPSLKYLTSIHDTRWVGASWFMKTEASLFASMSDEQIDLVLENLVDHSRIEYDVEHVVAKIAAVAPEAVFRFFGKRLAHDKVGKKSDEGSKRYEAVPYEFHDLQKPLSSIPDRAVDIARDWYQQDRSLFEYRGGRVLANVFPTIPAAFSSKLESLVQSGNVDDVDFVLEVLGNYEGEKALHEVCKAVVNVLPEGDSRLSHVEIILQSTGVLVGEFGLVEAYKQKKAEIEYWLTDNSEKIQKFARRYLRDLDQQIASEQRRAEESRELRRRDYESPEES